MPKDVAYEHNTESKFNIGLDVAATGVFQCGSSWPQGFFLES